MAGGALSQESPVLAVGYKAIACRILAAKDNAIMRVAQPGSRRYSVATRRIHKGHGVENLSRPCRMALSPQKNELSLIIGFAGTRKTCGWDDHYLLKVINQ